MPTYTPPLPVFLSEGFDYAALLTAIDTTRANIQAVRPDTPSDGSPGALALLYEDAGAFRHSCRVRLTTLGDPYNYPQMLAEANRLGEGLSHALPATEAVQGFAVYNATGVQIFAGLLSASFPGDHVARGTLDSNSYSVSLTGRGLAPGPGFFPGNTLTRFFPRTGYDQGRGRKFLDLSLDPGLLLWAAALGTSTVAWADAHGWKAGIRPTCPIQFNAAVQRKSGV